MDDEIKALDTEITAKVNELKKSTVYDGKRLKIIEKLTELLTKQNELLKQKNQ